jgi:hypothetical protein
VRTTEYHHLLNKVKCLGSPVGLIQYVNELWETFIAANYVPEVQTAEEPDDDLE